MTAAGENQSEFREGRPLVPWMLSAAAIAIAIWLATGAIHWRGYPTEHPNGRAIAALLGVLAQVTLLAIGWLAIRRPSPSWPACAAAIVAWTATRLVSASLYPLGSDEAYHWLWAQHLDLCYYDHPGMIAWLARLFAPFGGEATAAVRLTGIVLGALMPPATALLAWMTTRDGDVARRSALIFMITPILSGSAFLMPVFAVLFFWLLATLQLWRALQTNRRADWLLLGLFYGCALNCNFTTFLFPICAAAYLLVSPLHRRRLFSSGPYLALASAAICFLPVIVWNARHDWLTFGFNFVKRHRDLAFHPDQLALYFGGLLLYLSPILAIGMLIAAISSLRSVLRNPRSAMARSLLFLATMGLGPLLAFLITSLLLKARAHYAVPAFVPLIILFVVNRAGLLRRWYRPAVIVGTVMTMGFWWVLLITALVPAPTMNNLFARLGAKDPDKPTAELYGWPALGQYLDASGERMSANSRTVVMAVSYAQASMAMHYSRQLDYAYSLDVGRSPYGQQFQLWAPLDRIPTGCNAILFRAGHWKDEPAYGRELARHFDNVERVDTAAPSFDRKLRYFSIWKGFGYRGDARALPRP